MDAIGTLFAKLCMGAGLRVHGTAEFHSVIKGYNSIFQIRVAETPVITHSNHYDLVLAFDKETTEEFLRDIVPDGAVIYDPKITEVKRSDIGVFPIPLRDIAKEKAGLDLAKNIVGLGAVLALLDYPIDPLKKMLEKQFGRKGQEIVDKNVAAAQAGYDYAKTNFSKSFGYQLKPIKSEKTFLADGNAITCMGAIKAGVKFVSEYPMTPSSSVLHFMAKHARDYNISVNHVEDEIAAMNMAVGAGWAGVRSMTATSGGGFALMTEAVSLAGMVEAPVVIFEVQRPGPSTGLPTRTGQGDLRQILGAGQGDYPRVIMSPGTHEEAFYMAHEAFNLAETYQCPVIVMSEKYLAEGYVNLPFLDTSYLKVNRGKLLDEKDIQQPFMRYAESADGISPRTIPGMAGGAHTSSSYEHREDGYFTEKRDEVTAMHARRMRKMDTLLAKLPPARLEGKKNADVTLVCWGATYGPATEAIGWLAKENIVANLLHIKYLAPFQPGVRELLETAKHPILIEGNLSAQLGGLIAEKVGVEITDKILDWSGRPFTPDQIALEVLKLIKK